jgi:hypothetical protein
MDQGSVHDCLADNNTHHGVAPVVLICRQVANSVNATVHMDKALTVVRGYIVTATTGTTWSWNRAAFLIILLRTGIQTGKIQRHARGESDTVESGEAVVSVDGHCSDSYERVVLRDLDLHLEGLAANVRGTFIEGLDREDAIVVLSVEVDKMGWLSVFGKEGKWLGRWLSTNVEAIGVRVVGHDKEGREGLIEGLVDDGQSESLVSHTTVVLAALIGALGALRQGTLVAAGVAMPLGEDRSGEGGGREENGRELHDWRWVLVGFMALELVVIVSISAA